MNVDLTVTIQRDTATPAVNRLLDAVSPARAAAAIGPVLQRLFRRHFLSLPPNKKHWPTTHFWKRAAKATHWAPHPEGVMISVKQTGVRQRLHGGPIYKRDRLLTIPANAHAYGTLAGEHAELEFVPIHGPHAVGALVQRPFHHSVKKPPFRIVFWLAKKVNQKGDRHVLPAREEILSETKIALLSAVKQR